MHTRLWLVVIGMSCLLASTACGSKVYERHVEAAYDAQGQPRKGYATLNLEFLDALDRDLKACYKEAEK